MAQQTDHFATRRGGLAGRGFPRGGPEPRLPHDHGDGGPCGGGHQTTSGNRENRRANPPALAPGRTCVAGPSPRVGVVAAPVAPGVNPLVRGGAASWLGLGSFSDQLPPCHRRCATHAGAAEDLAPFNPPRKPERITTVEASAVPPVDPAGVACGSLSGPSCHRDLMSR